MIARSQTVTLCLLLFVLLAIGCGEDEGDPMEEQGGPPPAAMVGTWVYQSVTVDGAPGNLTDVLEWVAGAVAAKMHIQSNGAYVYEEVATNGGQLAFEQGFVFVNGNSIDINIQFDDDGPVNETSTATFALAGGVLTLQEVDQGKTIVFTLTM